MPSVLKEDNVGSKWLVAAACTLGIALSATSVRAQTVSKGITVGAAKVFDNRALVIMLEQLEAQLQAVRAVDQQKLLATVGTLQGAQTSDVSRSLTVGVGAATPKITTVEKPVDGTLQTSERTTEQAAAAAPAAPAAPALSSSLSYSPTFGIKAEDLLSDQVSLSYQIFNVRMLLERALSDRLYNNGPRLQVVLGFQIGLDPETDAKGKAAFVELTVKTASGKPLSLVSVMPYEKTYNAYALNRKSNAFGGAGIVSVVTLGYSQQNRSETLYLYRDADTLAFMNPESKPESDAATFGWEFRPVLGRKAVSPGLRQMFAVLALPVGDAGEMALPLTVTARTSWRKYDGKNLTVAAADAKQPATVTELGNVDVHPSSHTDKYLAPAIDNVTWSAIDADNAIVTVTGRNFFPGTQVLLGPTAHDAAATGLLVKSDQIMELRTTLRDLALTDGHVSGRYGAPVPLIAAPMGPGILINTIRYRVQPGRATTSINVLLQRRDGMALDRAQLPMEEPLLTVGTALASALYSQSVPCMAAPDLSALGPTAAPARQVPETTCVQFTGTVPSTAFEGEPAVRIKFPFRGTNWKSEFPIYAPSNLLGVTRVGGDKVVRLAITGRGFERGWKVIIDKEYTVPEDHIFDTLILVDVDAAVLAKYKKLIVEPLADLAVVLDIPDGKPVPVPPKLDPNQKRTIKKDSSAGISFTGTGLGAIKSAKFEGKDLVIKADDDGKKLTVYATRDVTAKTGEAVIMLQTDDGFLPVTVTIEG